MLSNPPYGKSWKSDLERMGGKSGIKDPRFIIEHGGDPEYSLITRSSDGQMLFLANMLSKMNAGTKLGSRIAEVHNGSSLFTGDAGQGESNIRRWIIENDWLEAIVALPLNMFYNTGIATYIWVLTNRKPEHRQGKVQLIDATQWFKPLRKNLGKKNCELAEEDIRRICDTFLAFKETEQSKIFPNAAFGYWKVTVERPLRLTGIDPNRVYSPKEIKALKESAERDEAAPPVIRKIHKKGTAADPLRGLFAATIDGKPAVVEYEPDGDLRDTEQVPLLEEGGIEAFLKREVLPLRRRRLVRSRKRQDRLRDQLHPLLLQAPAAAHAGGDPRRHPGAGEGDRGAARRNHRRRKVTHVTQRYSVTPHPIETLLTWVKSGEIAIPEIQRPFVWEATKVRNLLDSLYQGYPVGYLIAWRNPTVKLKDGTSSAGKRILIDGQQRVTALMAALLGREVLTKDYETVRIRIAFHPSGREVRGFKPSHPEEPSLDADVADLFSPDAKLLQITKRLRCGKSRCGRERVSLVSWRSSARSSTTTSV